jgi:hypothetical protein
MSFCSKYFGQSPLTAAPSQTARVVCFAADSTPAIGPAATAPPTTGVSPSAATAAATAAATVSPPVAPADASCSPPAASCAAACASPRSDAATSEEELDKLYDVHPKFIPGCALTTEEIEINTVFCSNSMCDTRVLHIKPQIDWKKRYVLFLFL